MNTQSISLDVVTIATPCTARWEEMAGDDRTHFCSHCSLNVYNLSAMQRDDAEALIAKAEGRLCIRFYRRTDGTVLTQDCPVGLRAVRQRVVRSIRNVAATTVTLLAGMIGFGSSRAFSQGSLMMGTMVSSHVPEPDSTAQLDTAVVNQDTVGLDTGKEDEGIIMGKMMMPEEVMKIQPTVLPVTTTQPEIPPVTVDDPICCPPEETTSRDNDDGPIIR